jgi:phage tail-like protein
MPVFKEYDPVKAFKFAVSLEGVEVGLFTSIDGLGSGRDVTSHAQGGQNDIKHMFYDREQPGRLTLKRGTDPELKLLEWFNQGIINGKVKRINMSIMIFDRDGKPFQNWDLTDCWPIKYVGPTLRADDVSPAAEEIEIAFVGITPTIIEPEA